jgi:O-antigen/teichoic acid export membrane protein
MSRTRRAVIVAGFTYAQLGLAVAAGLVLIPFILSALGPRSYGLWLAASELIAYAAMLDLGVVATLPWLIARADGRRDVSEMRAILCRATTVAALAGVGVTLVALAAWRFTPAALRLTQADVDALAGPLLVVVGAMALTYPLRVFSAALVGLQDVVVAGCLGVSQTALTVGLTVWLLADGYGLYAVAIAAAVPPAVSGVASLFRLKVLKPEAMQGWPRPDMQGLRWILLEGGSGWIAGLGSTMAAATSGLVITVLGHPEWVVVYACTAKLPQLLSHLARALPDSGLVGLGQIDGEGLKSRVQRTVGTILRLHLLLGGAASAVVLLVNPVFVPLWVGEELFGGFALNVAMAAAMLFVSLTHGLVCCAAVLGQRRAIGAVTLAYGLLTIVSSIGLGAAFGLAGIAAAPIVSGVFTTLPAGVLLLRRATEVSWRWLREELGVPWMTRLAPFLLALLAVQASTGRSTADVGAMLIVGAAAATAYVWWMRPLYLELPFHPVVRGWLGRLRLTVPTSSDRVGEIKPWA